jgi:hypothetical protein
MPILGSTVVSGISVVSGAEVVSGDFVVSGEVVVSVTVGAPEVISGALVSEPSFPSVVFSPLTGFVFCSIGDEVLLSVVTSPDGVLEASSHEIIPKINITDRIQRKNLFV